MILKTKENRKRLRVCLSLSREAKKCYGVNRRVSKYCKTFDVIGGESSSTCLRLGQYIE